MKLKIMCSVLLMSLSGASMAAIKESCPEPTAIQHTAGIYTAAARTAGNEWLGVVSSPAPKEIKAFESATFYSGEGTKETVGVFGKCTYISENGDAVDLRYQQGRTSEVSVKLKNTSAWQREDGPFGLVVYECKSKEKSACAFVIRK